MPFAPSRRHRKQINADGFNLTLTTCKKRIQYSVSVFFIAAFRSSPDDTIFGGHFQFFSAWGHTHELYFEHYSIPNGALAYSASCKRLSWHSFFSYFAGSPDNQINCSWNCSFNFYPPWNQRRRCGESESHDARACTTHQGPNNRQQGTVQRKIHVVREEHSSSFAWYLN